MVGGGGTQNVFGPAVQGTSTEQNVERGLEGRGNTRKHEWNSFHRHWNESARTDVFSSAVPPPSNNSKRWETSTCCCMLERITPTYQGLTITHRTAAVPNSDLQRLRGPPVMTAESPHTPMRSSREIIIYALNTRAQTRSWRK